MQLDDPTAVWRTSAALDHFYAFARARAAALRDEAGLPDDTNVDVSRTDAARALCACLVGLRFSTADSVRADVKHAACVLARTAVDAAATHHMKEAFDSLCTRPGGRAPGGVFCMGVSFHCARPEWQPPPQSLPELQNRTPHSPFYDRYIQLRANLGDPLHDLGVDSPPHRVSRG